MNAGKGIAIEISLTNWDDLCKVNYKNDNDDLDDIKSILTRKSTDWEYEEEWRYLKKSDKRYIMPGRITKVYFGTPYEHLKNYDEIRKHSDTLKRYLKLKKELEIFSESEGIVCEDYDFKKLHISKEKSVFEKVSTLVSSIDYIGENN